MILTTRFKNKYSTCFLGYGTMPNMKAFEENDSRTGTQVSKKLSLKC